MNQCCHVADTYCDVADMTWHSSAARAAVPAAMSGASAGDMLDGTECHSQSDDFSIALFGLFMGISFPHVPQHSFRFATQIIGPESSS